jgi:MoaA/NifB/PqqE/SkfB family radical SAM enzyme
MKSDYSGNEPELKKKTFPFPLPVPPGPEIVHLDLINACNLNCISCWNHSSLLSEPKPADWKRQKMDLALAIRLLDEFERQGVKRIILSGGGEIFLHRDIYQIIKQATQSLRMKCTLITNLHLCRDLDFLVQRKVDTVMVNMHAATSDTYQVFHPNSKKESFSELLEKIIILRKKHIRVKLVSVINNVNVHEIKKIIELAGELSCQIQFKLASPVPGTQGTMLSKGRKTKLLQKIPKLIKLAKKLGIKETNLEVFADQLKGGKSHLFPIKDIGCYAGYYYARIRSNGDVAYCCKPLPMGNLLDKNFSEIWTGEKYRKTRKKLAKGKFFPFCKACGKYDLNFKAHELLRATGEDPIQSEVKDDNKN